MKSPFDITGRKAIVTGGAQGLARGQVEGLLESGVHVAILDVNPAVVETAAEYVSSGYTCFGFQVDLGDDDAREKVFATAVEQLGGLDILCNTAGVQRRYPSEDFPLEDFRFVMKVNAEVPFAMCQLAGRHFLEQSSGKIINVASMLSFFGGYTVPAYAASKGAVAQLTKALCNEWASQGINVNAIAPGYMATSMNTALLDEQNPRYREITDRIPAKKWGTPEDVKGITVFLSSHASDYLNGAVIPVDGGYLVR